MLKFNYENTGIEESQILKYAEQVEKLHNNLMSKADDEKEFLGWINWPTEYDKAEFERIKKAGQKIQNDSDILVVIGIGGSYLGARAVIDALTHTFHNQMEGTKTPKIVYAGNNLSSVYLNDLLELVAQKDISVNVISKSGTTTEPAIAFRIFRDVLETKYGVEEARKRIYVTTDKARGALKTLSDTENYETFVIPDNIGGRFSVLTAVGLLPICASGIDIDKLMEGARIAQKNYSDPNLKYNDAYKYAIIRNMLYANGKHIEVLSNFEPKLHYVSEWWKQLFGESEGKDNKGLFPASIDLTTDLHSMGQYMQEGVRQLIETFIKINKPSSDLVMQADDTNLDGLNYLAGKSLDYINSKAMEATVKAHANGDVPVMQITMECLDEQNLGELLYFFEKAVSMSGSVLGVNPFNQPGVEEYKRNMFELLEKPGYTK